MVWKRRGSGGSRSGVRGHDSGGSWSREEGGGTGQVALGLGEVGTG